MDHQNLFEDALRQLQDCDYEVFSKGQGYIVQHLTDRNDISHARDLNDLVELADLMEWAEHERRSPKRQPITSIYGYQKAETRREEGSPAAIARLGSDS